MFPNMIQQWLKLEITIIDKSYQIINPILTKLQQ